MFDQRLRDREQAARGREDGLCLCGRVREGMGTRRPREVFEAESEDDGATDASSCPQAARDAIDERDEIGVDFLG